MSYVETVNRRREKDRQRNLAIAAFVASALAAGFVGLGGYLAYRATDRALAAVAPLTAPPVVTYAEFEQLRDGLSIRDAEQIIGAVGRELASNSVLDSTAVVYAWQNGDGSNMNATFLDGRLVGKAQFGLR